MGVVEGREKVEDLRDFCYAVPDGIAGKWDVSHGGAEEVVARGRCARDSAVEGIDDVNAQGQDIPAPNQRLLGVQVKADFRSDAREKVEDDLELVTTANEGAVVEEKGVEKEIGAVILDAKKKRVEDEGEKERG